MSVLELKEEVSRLSKAEQLLAMEMAVGFAFQET
jgi:hypothetical protein